MWCALTMLWKTVGTWSTAIFLKASPRMPSKRAVAKVSASSVVAPNTCSGTSRPATVTVSLTSAPLQSPEPYSMAKVSFSFVPVLDFSARYLECRKHATEWQPAPGTQRFALPVSKTTVNSCAGVPMLTVP